MSTVAQGIGDFILVVNRDNHLDPVIFKYIFFYQCIHKQYWKCWALVKEGAFRKLLLQSRNFLCEW